MSTQETALAKRTAGNENTSLLKILAIALMIVDHVGAVFFTRPRYIVEMRFFGRIAFPLFAWCLVVGTEYTRNIWKYLLRLLVVGLIAQPCYMLGLKHQWHELSIFATLLLGAAGIAGIRTKKYGSHIWAPLLAMAIPLFVKMDYDCLGVGLILGLYACRKSKGAIACFFAAFCMYWGWISGSSLSSLFGFALPKSIPAIPYLGRAWTAVLYLQFWAILALPLMIIPMGRRFKVPQWVWYAAYPVHLLVIGVIRNWDSIQQFFTQFQ